MIRNFLLTLLPAALLGVGCADLPEDWTLDTGEAVEPTFDIEALDLDGAYVLTADIEGNDDSDVKGTVALIQKVGTDSVRITGEILGLAPGEHGFHIHESGDCSADDFSSAGGHFSPEGNPHGAPSAEAHHAGDLGNIQANEEGVATVESDSTAISLVPGTPHSVLARSVIVHADADDLESQPSGYAGARVGCGVLRLYQAPEESPQDEAEAAPTES